MPVGATGMPEPMAALVQNRHAAHPSCRPILPGLRAILEATPGGHMSYLVTQHGKPFTAPGFGNKFRDRCNQAGLHHCSAHGIRKFDATAAAETAPRRTSSW